MPRLSRVLSSFGCETPSWFVSRQSLSSEKTASRLSITPSSLPPRKGLSYSANARNPFGSEEVVCGVTLPNNSLPLSMSPLPFRSSTNHASSDSAEVQEIWSACPLPKKSKTTPPVHRSCQNRFRVYQ